MTFQHSKGFPPPPIKDADIVTDTIPGIIVGTLLVLFGAGLIQLHRTSWFHRQLDADLSDDDLSFFSKQYRRRMQTSGLLILIGFLIVVGDAPYMPWKSYPGLFAAYWGGILLIAFWVILSAIGDMSASRIRSSTMISRIQDQQRLLEKQILELREKKQQTTDKKSHPESEQ
ncbi:sugar porter family MFS transporter [Gimesia aquarii]|uniref:Uncharacterized protein n=1 Tax=Gimesia aquarii TaxID=2527964 RepID=A0A517VRV6_9PLAN|nr:sugar porter family MFS transporter [Gimesia aquarii]QDT95765.1 hypothetical protein V144x_12120 [Gimesia aquarii]QDU08028.1 hypothetical protein V202x_13910 [Gimesia aquarii]